jgi:hypothetical protein
MHAQGEVVCTANPHNSSCSSCFTIHVGERKVGLKMVHHMVVVVVVVVVA